MDETKQNASGTNRYEQQREFLRAFVRRVLAQLLERAHHWPSEWSEAELKELAFEAFNWERDQVMSGRSDRRLQFMKTLVREGLL